MNPCPCDYSGDSEKACTCSSTSITKYQKRISGQLLARVNTHAEILQVDDLKLSSDRLRESEAIQSTHLAEALHTAPS